MTALELELASAATAVAVGFFRRLLEEPSKQLADEAGRRVVSILERLGYTDPATSSALGTLSNNPDDPAAQNELEQRIRATAEYDSRFRDDLQRSMQQAHVRESVSFISGAGFVGSVGNSARVSLKNINRKSGALWLIFGAAAVLLILGLVCGGTAIALARNEPTFFDTKTDLKAVGGWKYRVSEAHLKTSPQLDGRGPAKPGYKYLYFDITVENLLDDREAPGIDFHFAHPASSLSGNCGATNSGPFGSTSSYSENIIEGWCLSNNNSLFGGASCFETNDSLFHSIDNLPPSGKNQVRCVDSYLAGVEFDLDSIRVYYLGSDILLANAKYPNMKEIPTAT
ncbi:hypothetical protein ACWKSP_36000 [Micromonosporaceae bacterium Da 78-11]